MPSFSTYARPSWGILFFCNVHAAQQLDHGDQRLMPERRHDLCLLQHTIDPVADARPFLPGLTMDIARLAGKGSVDDGIQQTQDGGFFNFQVICQQISTSSGSNPAIPIHRITQNVK